MPADSVERRAERVTIEVDIDFRRPGDHRYRVYLLDFSALGCRIEFERPLYPSVFEAVRDRLRAAP